MSKNYVSWNEAEREAPIFQMENLALMHRQYQFKHFEGVLLTIVEELGLRETQEKAAKNHIRDEIWNFARMGMIIPNEMDDELGNGRVNPSQVIPKKVKK